MVIHHISLCTTNMERVTTFYKKYFGAMEHSSYHNEKTGLRICTLQFDKGALLEVTTRPGFGVKVPDRSAGYNHLALSAGDPDSVDFVVQRLANDGHTVVSPPHYTGHGTYESTVLDPDGNWVEINGIRDKPLKE